MQIKLLEKFNILSHDIGRSFLVLKTSYFVKIYPGLLFFKDLNSDKQFKIFLKFNGPVKNFTIIQNLLNGNLEVFFHTEDGFVSYKISTEENSGILFFDRITDQNFKIEFNELKDVNAKETIKLPIKTISSLVPNEKIFFGIHKKPDLYFVKKREDILEILPFIFLYSQFYLDVGYSCCLRKDCLLKDFDKEILRKDKQELTQKLLNIFKVHFFGAFIPRLNDEEYQNIVSYFEKDANPFCVFIRLYHSIKSLFINTKDDELSILPCLLTDLHHGRVLNFQTPFGVIDLEWSKKLLKKVIFKPSKDVSLKLVLQSSIKNFRLREGKNEKGQIFNNEDVGTFQNGKIYLLDKFMK